MYTLLRLSLPQLKDLLRVILNIDQVYMHSLLFKALSRFKIHIDFSRSFQM